METLSALLAFCGGDSPVNGEFPAQRPVSRSLDVFFDLCPKKLFSKQRRRYFAHYDVIVMFSGDSGQRGPYSLYKQCNHSLYIGIIIFPHIDNTQSTGHNLL